MHVLTGLILSFLQSGNTTDVVISTNDIFHTEEASITKFYVQVCTVCKNLNCSTSYVTHVDGGTIRY